MTKNSNQGGGSCLKLNKPFRPLHPVLSTCGISTYNLSQRLSSTIRPLVASSKLIFKNTVSLVDAMKDVTLMDDEVFVSYDVKSLFTNIPVEEAILWTWTLHADATLLKRTIMSVPTIIFLLRLPHFNILPLLVQQPALPTTGWGSNAWALLFLPWFPIFSWTILKTKPCLLEVFARN